MRLFLKWDYLTASFGGDYWTRTIDFLRVKMSQGREERVIPPFPPLLAQNDLLSAPLFPLSTACSDSSLGHSLGHVKKCKVLHVIH